MLSAWWYWGWNSSSIEIINIINKKKEDEVELEEEEESIELIENDFQPNLPIENFADYYESQQLNILSIEEIIQMKLVPHLHTMCEKCHDTYCEFEGGSVAVKCVFCGVYCNNGTCERKHIDKYCVKRQLYGLESFFDE